MILIGRILLLALVSTFALSSEFKKNADVRMISYVANPKTQEIKLYWKDDKGNVLKNIGNLQKYLLQKKQSVVFAMNAGMFQWDNSPQGLFIQNQQQIHALDTTSGRGNFYLKPNGVFALTTDNKPIITTTPNFSHIKKIKYATQSGPMLVIDGQLHPAFRQGSANLNIRNGVGVLPDNRVVFVISREPVNFYDFALYFKSLGCKNALYLDGAVSKVCIPDQNWIQTEGDLGVLIGITEPAR